MAKSSKSSAPDAFVRNAANVRVCVNCKGEMDPSVIVPMRVHEDDGSGEGKSETWCPQCFVYVRAPKEPRRFHPGAYAALKCAACGVTSVDPGRGVCGQCSSKSVIVLPPSYVGVA